MKVTEILFIVMCKALGKYSEKDGKDIVKNDGTNTLTS